MMDHCPKHELAFELDADEIPFCAICEAEAVDEALAQNKCPRTGEDLGLYEPPTLEELAKANEIISRARANAQARPILTREEAISELNAARDAVSAELNRESTGDQG